MNLTFLKQTIMRGKNLIVKCTPSILTGMAVAGTISTVIFSIHATNQAKDLIDEELENRLDKDATNESEATLSKKEAVKLVWKCYIPTVCMGTATIACIIGANAVNLRRNAAIAGLYSLTEANFKEYKEKVIEEIGKKKSDEIQTKVYQDKVTQKPPKQESIIMSGYGNTLCWDILSDRYFRSDLEKLRQIQNDLNRQLLSEMWISLNEVYTAIGLKEIRLGYDLGWGVDHPIDFKFEAVLTDDGTPCLCLDYEIGPTSSSGWRD